MVFAVRTSLYKLVRGWSTHKLEYAGDARNFVKFRRFGPFFGEGGKRRIPRNSIVADCARVDLRARHTPRARTLMSPVSRKLCP